MIWLPGCGENLAAAWNCVPHLGLPVHSRRARRPGSAVGTVHRLRNPASGRHLARAPTHRANLGAVRPRPSRSDPGHRLLPRGPARRHHDLRPGGRRARHPTDPDPWRDRAPEQRLGDPAAPEPADRPRRTPGPREVPAARSGYEVHCGLGCGVHRRRDQDPAKSRSSPTGERDHGTVDRWAAAASCWTGR